MERELKQCFSVINQFIKEKRIDNIKFVAIVNDDFKNEIINELNKNRDRIIDSNDVFLRHLKILNNLDYFNY